MFLVLFEDKKSERAHVLSNRRKTGRLIFGAGRVTALSRNGLAREKTNVLNEKRIDYCTCESEPSTRTFFPDPCVIQIGGGTNDPTSLDSEKDFIGFLKYIAAHTSLARPRREET